MCCVCRKWRLSQTLEPTEIPRFPAADLSRLATFRSPANRAAGVAVQARCRPAEPHLHWYPGVVAHLGSMFSSAVAVTGASPSRMYGRDALSLEYLLARWVLMMAGPQTPVYDRIGGGYTAGRREDPRIAQRIWAALGDALTVVNVGAGTGSYEPTERRVVAVEPSGVMLSQRPSGAARAVQASAEALPFADDEFDAAMAVLSVHHWTDKRKGLAEMRRVARGSVVVFTRVSEASGWWWLYDYFPATARLVAGRETTLREFEAVLGAVDETPVPIPADCVDGFEAAYWRRPGAILDPQVWPAMSALALIRDSERARGMRRLRADLDSGEWERRWSGLLKQDELDLGYLVLRAH